MASSAPSGYVPSVQRPDIMRSILEQIVVTGDVIGTDGPCRTILAITVDNWLRQHSPGTRSVCYAAPGNQVGPAKAMAEVVSREELKLGG